MIQVLWRAPVVPVQLIHEFAHVAAAAPWAEDWEVVIGPAERDVAMDTFVEFEEDAPRLAVAFAHLAPFVSGLLGALVAGLLMMLGGVSGPRSAWDLLLWSALALAWALFTRPSGHDLEGARAAFESQEADDDGSG